MSWNHYQLYINCCKIFYTFILLIFYYSFATFQISILLPDHHKASFIVSIFITTQQFQFSFVNITSLYVTNITFRCRIVQMKKNKKIDWWILCCLFDHVKIVYHHRLFYKGSQCNAIRTEQCYHLNLRSHWCINWGGMGVLRH